MGLRRIRTFRVPGDPTLANELAGQLAKFEENVDAMGRELLSAHRLVALGVSENAKGGVVVAPGQFQVFDSRAAAVPITLQKPTAADSGKWLVLADRGGGANDLDLTGQDCLINAAATFTSTVFLRVLFCDGTDYWTVA